MYDMIYEFIIIIVILFQISIHRSNSKHVYTTRVHNDDHDALIKACDVTDKYKARSKLDEF